MDNDATRGILILKPGAEIDRYKLLRELGTGGMGQVYLASDSSLGREVALKFLPPTLALDDTFRERLMREARAAAALNHPNVVTIYEVSEYEGYVYIAMEYVDGTSLRDLIDQKPLSVASTLGIGIQICDGLAMAHTSGIVHRDVKPHNIMIDQQSRVRILDFGLAKDSGEEGLTQAGTMLGTLSYMSPEQTQGKEPDQRSDIFALGVVLFEMLTGTLPFKRDNMAATLYAIAHDPHPALKSLLPDMTDELPSIVDRTLAKDPSQRYGNVADLKQDLMRLSEKMAASSSHTATIGVPVSVEPVVDSLAVLCLNNLGSPDDDFLAYGVTEDLIVDMTRLGAIRVSSMRSVMPYKGSLAGIDEICKKLQVTYVLDGSIQRTAETIRISAQLISASGDTVWAQRWEQNEADLPSIKKSLATGIAKALDLTQEKVEQAEIGRARATNSKAYENYLKAKYTFEHKSERLDVDIAMGLYALALKEEPGLLAARAGLSEIMMYNGDYASARIELASALEEANKKGSRVDQVIILGLQARLLLAQSKWDEAKESADQALLLTREIDDLAGEADILGILISILQKQARFDDAVLLFDRVLQISRKMDDQEKTIEALKSMGVAYSRKGDYDRALSLYSECCEMAKTQDNRAMQAACLSNTGNVFYYRGDFDQAYDHYLQAFEIASVLGDRPLAARQNLNMGLVKLLRGEYQKGLPLLKEAGEVFRQVGDKANYALVLINTSQARLSLGEVDRAVKAAKEALAIAREINQPLAELDALAQLGSAHFFNRDIDTATDFYRQALEIAEASSMTRNLAHVHLAMVNVCFYCKDYDQCKEHATKALAFARELGEKSALILSQAGLAAVEACEGLYNMGLRQLQDANREMKRIGNPEMKLHLQALMGEILLNRSDNEEDRNEGREVLRTALEDANTRGLAPEIKLLTEILAGVSQ